MPVNCDPVDQLQLGNGPKAGNGWRNAWQPFFGEGPKWPKKWQAKWPARQQKAKFPAICPPFFFGHCAALPAKNGRRTCCQPFPVLGPFPTCSWSTGSQRGRYFYLQLEFFSFQLELFLLTVHSVRSHPGKPNQRKASS